MKFKIFTLMLLLVVTGLSAQTAKFGMQTEIGGGIALSDRSYYSSLQLHFSPGFRLDPSWFMGMGVGVSYRFMQPTIGYSTLGFTITDDAHYFWTIPVYAHATYALPTQGSWAPFVNLKLGYGIVDRIINQTSNNESTKYSQAGGLYASPSIGVRYKINDKHALSLSASYDSQSYTANGQTIREFHGIELFWRGSFRTESLSLRLGWEF